MAGLERTYDPLFDPIIVALFVDPGSGDLIDKDGRVVFEGFLNDQGGCEFDYVRKSELLHKGETK